jgi:cellobiose phosphorylase
MSTIAGMHDSSARPSTPEHAPRRVYGHFVPDGGEYVITDPRTPRPWTNIIANERVGLAVSQTGSGFTWIDNSQLAVVTRWIQDLTEDTSGKFLYLRDVDSGEMWSLTPAPMWRAFDHYACRHGMGFTTFESELAGIRSDWTQFVHAKDPIELWRVALRNTTDRPRRLELVAYLEWNCGVAPSPRREFTKLFIENHFDAGRNAIFARCRMWEVPTERQGHWNTEFPYVSGFAAARDVKAAEGDKLAFLGRYGNLRWPAALPAPEWAGTFGSHGDAIAALRVPLTLEPGEEQRADFALAMSTDALEVEHLLAQHRAPAAVDDALAQAQAAWTDRFAAHRIETSDQSVNDVINDWVRYQAISGRLWGRAGYYQQSGAYGFRDQLQDSQVWLTIEPQRCRDQINLHARHQFADGSVYHWWHPLSEQGLITTMTDDLLWLGFAAANYIKETGDLSVLDDQQPFLDEDAPATIAEHVRRAFERVFKRTSPRGLPYIGAGDWNDGLSAAGLQEKGESIWLGHFLAGLLADWAEIYDRRGMAAAAQDFRDRHLRLVAAINEHGWDGAWYIRATLDDGSKLGSKESTWGKIFLNAQTWAILNDVAPPDRAQQCLASLQDRLFDDVGALLLAPAYDTPTPEIGYITRYAPGLRENGGVYTHAATWAIAAAAKMGDHASVAKLLNGINPANKDSDSYWAEPYVTPGNVDGPDSPLYGRAGWTWYTGSAAWLHRVVCEWVLGVRPEWGGLRIAPCLPTDWQQAAMTRPYRGATYRVQIQRDATLPVGSEPVINVDGAVLKGDLIEPAAAGSTVTVSVQVPPAA